MQFHFSGFTYDADRVELRRGADVVEAQPKVLAFIHLLLVERGRALAKSEILDRLWPDVTVDEGSLQRVVSLARRALDGQGDEVIATVRGVGYRLDAEVRVDEAAVRTMAPGSGGLEQTIHFATTSDDVRIAWSAVGEGPPLVRSLGWFTNLESEWRCVVGRSFWERMARHHRLVRYDGRGIGLSDACEHFSPESRLRDLEAVVDAAGLERFALVGMSEGSASAIRYAIRHPDRVTRLVLYGIPPSLVGLSTEGEAERWRTLLRMVRQGWGDPTPVYRQFFSTLFLGAGAERELLEYFNEMQRASADATTVAHYLRSLPACSVEDIAHQVTTPTLVLHRRGDVLCPFDGGRRLASLVPGARFVPLEGENHWLIAPDPASEVFFEAIDRFLYGEAGADI
jgi:pimeloyl-ACP methyl ester carboxylesterase/DNA-binding winged helix-turn-helix (wHTH) protein